MAELIGPWVQAGDTSVVDTALKHELGARAMDDAGNEYIYLTGVVSTVAGDWVVFDEAHLTTRAVASAKGRAAIAMAAIGASQYGWYLIYGTHATANVTTGCADDSLMYLTATAGRVDDAVVTGDAIIGAICRGLAAGNVAPVELDYPIVTGVPA